MDREDPSRQSGLKYHAAKNGWSIHACKNNKMYRFACRMFGTQCGEKREDNWISIGVTGGNWKNSVKRIREHAATQYLCPAWWHSKATCRINQLTVY